MSENEIIPGTIDLNETLRKADALEAARKAEPKPEAKPNPIAEAKQLLANEQQRQAQIYQMEYADLCKRHGFVMQSVVSLVPGPDNVARFQVQMAIAPLEVQR
jgi:hypothetical protein